MTNNDHDLQDYMDFDDIDNIYEVDSPREEECLWVGKPHVLCYTISQLYITFIIFLFIFWYFDFNFKWYSFINNILLMVLICELISTFKYAKTIKYYITGKYVIVKSKGKYWGYPKENIAIRQQKTKILSTKQQFIMKHLGGFLNARTKQNIIEKLFGVKTIQFQHKLVNVGDSSKDIYYEKGNFRCIKDYEKVIKILGI
ncbi:hypothetical protein [Thomasclavelia cocleata]|uniref:hypothetical protein n=1 Tax=Thomasclavelia cocleata TaxID=69824 RepID=UPI00256FC664|nr:hypothetical protein [Thomasclavelia cocleata]